MLSLALAMAAPLVASSATPPAPADTVCGPNFDPHFVRYVEPEQHRNGGPMGLLIRNDGSRAQGPAGVQARLQAPATCAAQVVTAR